MSLEDGSGNVPARWAATFNVVADGGGSPRSTGSEDFGV